MTAPRSLPLRALQEQFWFREMMHPGSKSNILTALLARTGGLDEGRPRRAARALVDRHPALRMRS